MQHLDINPRVQNFGDTIIVDLCPGVSLRLAIVDSLKLLADLNRSTQRAMQHVQQEPEDISLDVTFEEEEETTQRRTV
jgi:hypothetical protein